MKFDCIVHDRDSLTTSTCLIENEPSVCITIQIAEWSNADEGTITELNDNGAQHIMSLAQAIEYRDSLSKFITDYQRKVILNDGRI
jgi:hypothetical protein